MIKSNGSAAAGLLIKTLGRWVTASKACERAARSPAIVVDLTRQQVWSMGQQTIRRDYANGLIIAKNGGTCFSEWGSSELPRRLQATTQGLAHRQLRCLSSKLPPHPPQQTESTTQEIANNTHRLRPLHNLMPVHENIYTLPNFLTLTRLVAAPVVGYLLAYEQYPAALGLFLYAGVTDLLDGWIARRWKLQTVVGTVVDPMADKALMTIVVVVLAVKEVLPVPLAVIILGRDILLGLSALYYRYISLPPPKTFARYWDFSLPSAEVKPTEISKWNTFFQLGLIGATMLDLAMGGFPATGVEIMGYPISGTNALELSWWIVGGTTIWSGLSYVGGRKGLRILSKR